MKTIQLTREMEALVDDGDFEMLSKYKWCTLYVTEWNIYAGRKSGKTSILMHNQILGGKGVDHRNGNGLDNQRGNLRFANHSENARNHKLPENNTSGVCGVYWDKQKSRWRAYLKLNSKLIALGRFIHKQDAIKRRREAESTHFGEFARTP